MPHLFHWWCWRTEILGRWFESIEVANTVCRLMRERSPNFIFFSLAFPLCRLKKNTQTLLCIKNTDHTEERKTKGTVENKGACMQLLKAIPFASHLTVPRTLLHLFLQTKSERGLQKNNSDWIIFSKFYKLKVRFLLPDVKKTLVGVSKT